MVKWIYTIKEEDLDVAGMAQADITDRNTSGVHFDGKWVRGKSAMRRKQFGQMQGRIPSVAKPEKQ